MGKIHLFARDNRKIYRNSDPKKRNKLLWLIIIGVICFIFFRTQILTALFFMVGFIV